MNSDEVIDSLELTGKLMELHNENPFKAKAYANAGYKLSKLRYDFEGKSQADIEAIEGIGKSISARIFELMSQGGSSELNSLLEKTPIGVVEMLGVKGLGPKKVRQLWLELNLESVGELLYACNENRLLALKGFGEKTQLQVKQSIEFKLSNEHKFHYASLEQPVQQLLKAIQADHPDLLVAAVGQMARMCEVVDAVELLIGGEPQEPGERYATHVPLPVGYFFCNAEEFNYRLVELSSTPAHLEGIGFSSLPGRSFDTEQAVYEALHLPFIAPELREGLGEIEMARQGKLPELIKYSDLRGCLHNHSTYSDGVHSLQEMADHCKGLGYEYLGICDHSKSAFYANGLSSERVAQQQQEIDRLNAAYNGFKIFKGIESDILNDGSLDYPEEVLKTFDFIVASVHSNLKMSVEKATERLIKAIENPYTTILGHPTGRLLLGRPGYPVDHRKVIDACAANGVSIELNAHPYRLDIDWRWIPYCVDKQVLISINPDAHHREGLKNMYYGVCAARKGALSRTQCLNALNLQEFEAFLRR